MDSEKDIDMEQLDPTSVINPRFFIYAGILAGIFIWIVDALIDHYIIEPDESFMTSLFYVEGTELWMRTLVMTITTAGGIFASFTFKKSLRLNILLYKYQFKLEELVKQRTNELVEKTEELEKLASIDPLTGIYNRRKFIEHASHEMNRFIRHRHRFSIFMLDIDNFKMINDNFGHDAGDEILKKVASLIKHSTRESDYFARWGGEEFIIMSPDSTEEGRLVLAEKIVKLIAADEHENIGHVTVSMGVSTVDEGDTDLDAIIKRADQGLYLAKEKGKNQFQLFE